MRKTLLFPLFPLFLLLLSCAEPSSEQMPSKMVIEVPFSPQAPHANWDAPYQEACEEMALIMGIYFLEGKELTPEIADREIQDLVKWETENGYPEDVTLEQLNQIGCEYYEACTNYVINQVTTEVIKEEIAKGNPVILPAAGRRLLNPYFSGDGPWYHMLIVTGYDRNEFITNDPGTKRGRGYKYKYDRLVNAIHDWTGVKEDIEKGQRKMMVIQASTSLP